MTYIYTFKWKVIDGVGHATRGEDTFESDKEITQDELEEEVSRNADGREYLFNNRSNILKNINECDASCSDWEIYKLKRRSKP